MRVNIYEYKRVKFCERRGQNANLYRKAWNTQESIAEILGVPQQTIADVIKNTEKRQLSDFGKTFQPILYNTSQKLLKYSHEFCTFL